MRLTGMVGIICVLLHIGAVLSVAPSDPLFLDPYHAVSDMGMAGRPHASRVNLLVFGATGVLLAIFGIGIGTFAGARIGGGLLAIGGVCFSLAGVCSYPDRYHFVAVGGAALFIAAGLALIGMNLGRTQWHWLRGLSAATAVAVLLNLALIPLELPAPGYIAKGSFLAVLVWVAIVSAALITRSGANAPQE